MAISLFHPHFNSVDSLSFTDMHFTIGIIIGIINLILMAATSEKWHADIIPVFHAGNIKKVQLDEMMGNASQIGQLSP